MKNLDSYKKSLQERGAGLIILTCLSLITVLVLNFYVRVAIPEKEDLTDCATGFFIGFEFACVFILARFFKAIRNHEVLKIMYLKETDERNILIRTKSGFPLVAYLSTALFLIGLIVGYFNYTAFLTITAVAIGQILISLILKLYWTQKL